MKNLQIQHDNLDQEAQGVQVGQQVPWVQAAQPDQPLLEVPVDQHLLWLPVGWSNKKEKRKFKDFIFCKVHRNKVRVCLS